MMPLRGLAAVDHQPIFRVGMGRGLFLWGVLLALLTGCTRYEETATLSLRRKNENGWVFEWSALARRGINLVDSSGNVGGARVTFPCQPDPQRPEVWLINSPAATWREKGDAVGKLGEKPAGAWQGEIRFEAGHPDKVMVVELRDPSGRPFVGNARYGPVQGNGETWVAQRL